MASIRICFLTHGRPVGWVGCPHFVCVWQPAAAAAAAETRRAASAAAAAPLDAADDKVERLS